MHHILKSTTVASIITLATLLSGSAFAQSATFTVNWDLPTSTTGVTGYKIYVRAASQASYPTTSYFAAGATTRSITISDKPVGSYFFVAKAFNGTAESLPSNEVAAFALPVTLQGRQTTQQTGEIINVKAVQGSNVIVEVNSRINAQGVITVPTGTAPLPAGINLRLKLPHFLATLISGFTPERPVTVELRAGDIDNNGRVDSIDWGYIKNAWGTSSTGPNDLYKDGVINALDYGILKGNWFGTDQG